LGWEVHVYTPTTIKPKAPEFPPSKLKFSKDHYFADQAEDFEITTFYHFPLLLLPNHSLWNYFKRSFYTTEELELLAHCKGKKRYQLGQHVSQARDATDKVNLEYSKLRLLLVRMIVLQHP
jgi:hypothetical protein